VTIEKLGPGLYIPRGEARPWARHGHTWSNRYRY